MIVTPKTRGFICTTAHPEGCAQNVREQIEYAKQHPVKSGPRRVLVVGASAGYGLASRIAAAFSCGAHTVGVSFERPASGTRTATAGHYNNLEFDRQAKANGLESVSISGDAFSKEIKAEAIAAIKAHMPDGKVDLIVYSLASPRRTDPETGETYASVIKPIGDVYSSKTVDFHSGVVSQVEVSPATEEEVAQTVKVMGGEDWLLWMQALKAADALEENAATLAYSYIGPTLTHAVYKYGTIGTAKLDLEEKCREISTLLSGLGGKAFVSVNKALVTQASSAIPVVPLYISMLLRLMKEQGTHEGCIEQMTRMFEERLYFSGKTDWNDVATDADGRIRMDDLEMEASVQQDIDRLWPQITTENLAELTDIEGYRSDFYRLFGFGLKGIDYTADVEI